MEKNKSKLSPTGPQNDQTDLSRRKFLQVVGVFAVGAGTASLLSCEPLPQDSAPETLRSMGYIVVDSRKCQGCLTCMIACSVAHEGSVNLSMARLQVTQNPFQPWPDDIVINQCHQCEDAPCTKACPTGALKIDTEHGNIRLIDESLCVGCGRCHKACIFEPERPSIVQHPSIEGHLISKKCDLCQNATHHFHPDGGGVNGVQICAAVCPMNAIAFTTTMPDPASGGFDTKLRDDSWEILGFSTS